ncbi:DUF4251 domain-containing protein [Mucilaginibacter boryungensis]|uniref:DUF4251 domain-containing protein n=1 Tax=Mucilaginibacter boryungensis TaxID=768480 RepID=A0ABR9XCX7_9SPHI|nr:DUF4251 domain-containing protein [Mucilaginibacter boryungensis]MBE9665256.1 DUF4251 domain-containing protein [Mucilaginibacter boryungensis]
MNPLKFTLLIILFVAGSNLAHAQGTAADLKKIADGKMFSFKPIAANIVETSTNASFVNTTPSMGNGHIVLKGDYVITIKPDSIVSYLPYFGDNFIQDQVNTGQSFTNIDVNENPSKITIKLYDYSVQQKKNGSVQITIKPKDKECKIEKMIFEFTLAGSGKLTMNITDHPTIKYDGKIL